MLCLAFPRQFSHPIRSSCTLSKHDWNISNLDSDVWPFQLNAGSKISTLLLWLIAMDATQGLFPPPIPYTTNY
jgi:hypothetical protein